MTAPLKADPIRIPDTGKSALTVTFYGRVTGGSPRYKYHWDFADGHTSDALDTFHTFKDPGFYNVLFRVTDALNTIFDTYVAVKVDASGPSYVAVPPPVCPPPIVGSIPSFVTTNVLVCTTRDYITDFDVVTPVNGHPVTFSVSGLPAGLTFSQPDPQTCRIHGTTPVAGVFTITVTATNDLGSANLVFPLSVAPVSAVVYGSSAPYNGEYRPCEQLWKSYQTGTNSWVFFNSNTNAGLAPRIWRKVSDPTKALFFVDTLDMWVLDNPTTFVGVLSTARGFHPNATDVLGWGSPITTNAPAEYSYDSTFGGFTVFADAPDCAPAAPTLADQSYSLPNGVPVKIYDIPLTAVRSWSLTFTGSPPLGMLLDTVTGVLTGTPAVDGNYTLNVTVHNPAGQHTAVYSFTVSSGK